MEIRCISVVDVASRLSHLMVITASRIENGRNGAGCAARLGEVLVKPRVRHRWRGQTSRASVVGDERMLKGRLLALRDLRGERGGSVWRGAGEGKRGSQRSSCYQYELMQVPQYAMLVFPLLR